MNRAASGISTITESQVSVRPMVSPKPGRVLRLVAVALTDFSLGPCSASSVLVDLIEDAAFGEVILLRPGPAAENVVDREKLDLGKGLFILLRNFGIARAIGIAGGDLLAFLGVPILQISLRCGARALLVGNAVDHRDRRLGQDRR